jgi:DNA invertase Pin-like site-specific DNA recombinase
VLWLVEDGKSAKTMNRPKIAYARELLASGQASMLLATKIDRVSRSITDFIQLIEDAERQGWRLVLTAMALDTSTATGRFVARLMGEIAELERERTSEALQAKKAQGARLGVPDRVRVPEPVRVRILQLRDQGETYTAICRALEGAGIRTARGRATWYPSSIQAVLDRA